MLLFKEPFFRYCKTRYFEDISVKNGAFLKAITVDIPPIPPPKYTADLAPLRYIDFIRV